MTIWTKLDTVDEIGQCNMDKIENYGQIENYGHFEKSGQN